MSNKAAVAAKKARRLLKGNAEEEARQVVLDAIHQYGDECFELVLLAGKLSFMAFKASGAESDVTAAEDWYVRACSLVPESPHPWLGMCELFSAAGPDKTAALCTALRRAVDALTRERSPRAAHYRKRLDELLAAHPELKCPLLEMPNDVLHCILLHLPAPALGAMAISSHRLSALMSSSPALWEALVQRDHPHAVLGGEVEDEEWKEVYMQVSVRAHCFMDFSHGSKALGRVVIKLYWEDTPLACENFRRLCIGDVLDSRKKCVGYQGSGIHRIIPDFVIQGGDYEKGNGSGGRAIYPSGTFKDESFENAHNNGSLSMANKGPNTNGSQFFICLGSQPKLDGKHVVFGRVLDGMEVVNEIAGVKCAKSEKPKTPVSIERCGVIYVHEW